MIHTILLCEYASKASPTVQLYVCPILPSELWLHICDKNQFSLCFFSPTLTVAPLAPFIHKLGLQNRSFSPTNIWLLSFCFKWENYPLPWDDPSRGPTKYARLFCKRSAWIWFLSRLTWHPGKGQRYNLAEPHRGYGISSFNYLCSRGEKKQSLGATKKEAGDNSRFYSCTKSANRLCMCACLCIFVLCVCVCICICEHV